MKNKSGFTLVELLAVIVVLAIIIAIAVPAYGKISNSVNAKQYENKLELIKVAALKYADDTNYVAFYIDDLITNGYLDGDQGSKVIDNRDNSTIMNCYVITILEETELNYAEVIQDTTITYNETSGCPANLPNNYNDYFKITIKENLNNSYTELKYDTYKEWWTKNNVRLEIIPAYKKDENGNTTTEQYQIDEIKWYEGLSQESIGSGQTFNVPDVEEGSVLQQNYTAKVKMTDKKEISATVRVYIDKIPPKFYTNNDKFEDKWLKTLKYSIQAYDNESGLYGYLYNIDFCPTLDNVEFLEGGASSSNTNSVLNIRNQYTGSKKNDITENGTYHVCLVDFVGNTSEDDIEVNKVDNTDMKCNLDVESGTLGNNGWYISNVTLKATPDAIGPSGVTLAIDSQNKKWPSNVSNFNYGDSDIKVTYDINDNTSATGTMYYGFIKNQTGEDKRCSKKMFVETSITAPNFSNATSTYDSITAVFDSGSAISEIKETKCYLTDSAGNITANGTLSGTNCSFNVPATSQNTTYYFKKCITSKAGNTACSAVYSKANVGYCTAGHFTTSIINKKYTTSCPVCYTGTTVPSINYTYNESYTSNYQNKSCGTSSQKSSSESCSKTPSCCSSVYYKETTCSNVCGGKYKREAYSNYNHTRCTNKDDYNGSDCGGSSKKDGEWKSECSNYCGEKIYADVIYYSTIDNSTVCKRDINAISKTCGEKTVGSSTTYYIYHDIYVGDVDEANACKNKMYYIKCTQTKYVSNKNKNTTCSYKAKYTFNGIESITKDGKCDKDIGQELATGVGKNNSKYYTETKNQYGPIYFCDTKAQGTDGNCNFHIVTYFKKNQGLSGTYYSGSNNLHEWYIDTKKPADIHSKKVEGCPK